MESGKLYKVSPNLARNGSGIEAVLILKGDTVDVQILGSKSKPSALSDMVDIAGEQIQTAGAFPFVMLTTYIYIEGTVSVIELENYQVDEELTALS